MASQMIAGEDGLTDAHGDALPVLSKSASMMDYDRLLNTPLPSFKGKTPGSPFFTWLGMSLLSLVNRAQFRSIETTGVDNIPPDAGTLCTSWHTNGLLDPISIMCSHPKRFVIGGRHDLATRPILGFWARKFALQPVVRKAELIRGGCSEEEASTLNGRTLLNLAQGISHGFGCALFPEGTSHSEASMLRLRTGPMRTVLASAALAKSENRPMPAIMPVGLHFRVRHHFRTDLWIEYGKPIGINAEELPEDLVDSVSKGVWAEPPFDMVNSLRDEVAIHLRPLTPNAPDWKVYRAWMLAGHLSALKQGTPLKSWREEVLAAREVRESEIDSNKLEAFSKTAEMLDKRGLDGRDLHCSRLKLKSFDPVSTLTGSLKLALGIITLPIFLLSLGPQVLLGRILGDDSDEGLDARTSFQYVCALFGSMMWWPLITAILLIVAIFNQTLLVDIFNTNPFTVLGSENWHIAIISAVYFILSFPLYWMVGMISVNAWDSWCDLRKFLTRFSANRDKNLLQALQELESIA